MSGRKLTVVYSAACGADALDSPRDQHSRSRVKFSFSSWLRRDLGDCLLEIRIVLLRLSMQSKPASTMPSLNTALGLFLGRKRRNKTGTELDDPNSELSAPSFKVRLRENIKHPTIELFGSKAIAAIRAKELGAPWVPVTYACGYLVTNGWSFCDVNGPLSTFCPVPVTALGTVSALVRYLKAEQIPNERLPAEIGQALQPLKATMPEAVFQGLCLCTLLRIGYPMPHGAEDDWLTPPAWGLMLRRRSREEIVPAKRRRSFD